MKTNLIVTKTTKLIDFLDYLFLNEKNRQCYLGSPKSILQQFEIEDILELERIDNIFYRFISDDDIWTAIQEKNDKKLQKLIIKRFPELKSNDIENAGLIINDVLVANNSIAVGQQIVVALSTLKVVAAISGFSEEELY